MYISMWLLRRVVTASSSTRCASTFSAAIFASYFACCVWGRCFTRKVDVRLPGKENSEAHGARPVHLIITMIKWIRTNQFLDW